MNTTYQATYKFSNAEISDILESLENDAQQLEVEGIDPEKAERLEQWAKKKAAIKERITEQMRDQSPNALTNTEILLFIQGYQGGTIHQLAKSLGVTQDEILNADANEMRSKFLRLAQAKSWIAAEAKDMRDRMNRANDIIHAWIELWADGAPTPPTPEEKRTYNLLREIQSALFC